MSDLSLVEWFYVGQYGQLGPLTLDQMKDLVRDGVIERATFVWHTGRTSWASAETYFELRVVFEKQAPAMPPPIPMPSYSVQGTESPRYEQPSPYTPPAMQQMPIAPAYSPMASMYSGMSAMPESDKSRIIAGILQLIFPGIGRMYLGYYAQGFIQLFSVLICAVGWFWSVIDGIAMIIGTPKFDGFGRRLTR